MAVMKGSLKTIYVKDKENSISTTESILKDHMLQINVKGWVTKRVRTNKVIFQFTKVCSSMTYTTEKEF